jgi:hypothetical protein
MYQPFQSFVDFYITMTFRSRTQSVLVLFRAPLHALSSCRHAIRCMSACEQSGTHMCRTEGWALRGVQSLGRLLLLQWSQPASLHWV